GDEAATARLGAAGVAVAAAAGATTGPAAGATAGPATTTAATATAAAATTAAAARHVARGRGRAARGTLGRARGLAHAVVEVLQLLERGRARGGLAARDAGSVARGAVAEAGVQIEAHLVIAAGARLGHAGARLRRVEAHVAGVGAAAIRRLEG